MKRQNVAPDGQVLPDWLTWSPVSPFIYPDAIKLMSVVRDDHRRSGDPDGRDPSTSSYLSVRFVTAMVAMRY